MLNYRAVVRRRRTTVVDEEVTVIVEACSFGDADSVARTAAQTCTTGEQVRSLDHADTSVEVGDIVSMSRTDLVGLEPECEFFRDQYLLRIVASGGVTTGGVVLWTPAARRLESLLRDQLGEQTDAKTVTFPDPISARILAHQTAEAIRRHPGTFAADHLNLVDKLDALLVGDDEAAPALIVRRGTMECIGVVTPRTEKDAGPAPRLVRGDTDDSA